MYYYATGQAGFSAHLTNSKNESELLIGAPGVYNWCGTTILYKNAHDQTPEASKIVRKPRYAEQLEFADLNVASAIRTSQTYAFSLTGITTFL